jgi:hypothetical protein
MKSEHKKRENRRQLSLPLLRSPRNLFNSMPDSHPSLELLMLGTGTSSGLPSIGCLTDPARGCFCCRSTLNKDDPEGRKNLRRNTSAVLRIPDKQGGRTKSLLIDVSSTATRDARTRLTASSWPTVRQDVLLGCPRTLAEEGTARDRRSPHHTCSCGKEQVRDGIQQSRKRDADSSDHL